MYPASGTADDPSVFLQYPEPCVGSGRRKQAGLFLLHIHDTTRVLKERPGDQTDDRRGIPVARRTQPYRNIHSFHHMMDPMETYLKPLHHLARRFGVFTEYQDGLGRERSAEPDILVSILKTLGCAIDSPAGAGEALELLEAKERGRILPPVLTVFGGGPATVALGRQTGSRLAATLELEHGGNRTLTTGKTGIAIPGNLPFGYHTLTVEGSGSIQSATILASPAAAFPPDSLFPGRSWGLFLPLYAMRSERSSGVGDLADLERLMDWTGSLGGSMVGVLPMNAAFLDQPFSPSPYMPASRLFWNELYLDPEITAGPAGDADVDYRATMAAKRKALEANNDASQDSRNLVRDDPYLLPYARFRAETERRGTGWRNWPEGPGSGKLTVSDDDPAVRYHLNVQLAFHRRLQSILESDRPGHALYLDLPLGVHPDSFDTWAHRSLFADDVTVGAPPDKMFTGGQNWRFPPLLPEANRLDGYRYFAETIRRQTRYASLLRIDHVMGLHRQFWIPDGADSSDGTYVTYPQEEYYAVLAIESHRNRCAVVGEDLGTVPPGVREMMTRFNLQRLFVAQVQEPADQPPAASVASFNTHDLPPFAGFLKQLDIDERIEHHLMGAVGEDKARTDRRNLIRQAIDTLIEGRFLKRNDPKPEELLEAWLRRLGAGPSRFMMVNAEDLWLETRAQNMPGTSDQRPNWVGRAALRLEDMEQSERITGMLRRLDGIRRTVEDTDEPG